MIPGIYANGSGDGMDNKAKKIHQCAWHNQSSTNEGIRLVTEHTNGYKYIIHAGLRFDSLLTWQGGLASVLFLVTVPFRKPSNFRQDIRFNNCLQHRRIPVNHVCKGHVNRKTSKYQRCSLFHSGRSHNEIPVWWQVNLPHLNLPRPETKGWVIEDNYFVPKLLSLFPLPHACLKLTTCTFTFVSNITWWGR